MKICTWNVNSVQVRLPQVLAWLETHQPDVLALQETKVMDEAFPVAPFQQLGYEVCISGQKSYNGVALIACTNLLEVCKDHNYFQDPSRRFLAATVNGVRIINLYVPNGQSVDSEKYLYKLDWLKAMHQYLQAELTQFPQLVVVGDFNIAPADKDVHDPVLWEGHVLVSPREREAFQAFLDLGLQDALRHHDPESPIYTWWDYRQGAFRRNRGLRIDHILVSPALLDKCGQVQVDKVARQAERPSDHAPVWVELAL